MRLVGGVMHTELMDGIGTPVGIFHANVTRDAEGQRRSGQPFYQLNELTETEPAQRGRLFEVMFGDGIWMLAGEQGLQPRP